MRDVLGLGKATADDRRDAEDGEVILRHVDGLHRFGRVARVSPYVRLPCVSKDMGWVNNNRTPVDHKIVNAHQRAVVSTILLGLWVYVAPYKPSGFVGIPVVVGWAFPPAWLRRAGEPALQFSGVLEVMGSYEHPPDGLFHIVNVGSQLGGIHLHLHFTS